MRHIIRLGPLLIALTLASHAPAQTATPAAAGAAAPGVVIARDFMFAPLTVTIAAGTTVTWTNRDDEPHTVVSDTGLFRSGALDTNESFSFRFDAPGTYHYACSIHPRMVGTIVVR
ncbi:MAG: cupredoxin family copper-binding protein [Gammaproteobacteria bacterium]|nr:cupredoxin family copper-binding protein [Gammaproteobacteria bacterium]